MLLSEGGETLPLPLPLLAKLCFGFSLLKHRSEECKLRVLDLQMPCGKDAWRQGRRGEENHLCGYFLVIYGFSKIN